MAEIRPISQLDTTTNVGVGDEILINSKQGNLFKSNTIVVNQLAPKLGPFMVLSDIGNVEITDIIENQVLKWNGDRWINSDSSAVEDLQIITENGNTTTLGIEVGNTTWASPGLTATNKTYSADTATIVAVNRGIGSDVAVFKGSNANAATSTIYNSGDGLFVGKIRTAPTDVSDPTDTLVTLGYVTKNAGKWEDDGTQIYTEDASWNVVIGSPDSPTITFDTSGSASFADRVDIGSSSLDDDVALKLMNNDAAVGSATLYVQNFNDSGNVWSGRNSDNDETSSIRVDGGATFADSVNVQAAGNPATRVNLTASTGEIFCSNSSKDTTEMFRIQGGRGSSSQEDVVVMTSSGSATFASTITAGDEVTTGTNIFASGSAQGIVSGSQKWYLGTDGSITAAGNVQSGGSAIDGAENGSILRSAGLIQVSRSNSYDTIWAGYTTGNDVPTSTIKAGGSITAAGDVQLAGNAKAGEAGIKLEASGLVSAARAGDGAAVFGGYTAGNAIATTSILNDGSASFAGPQTLGTAATPATNGYTSHIDNTTASTAAGFNANNQNADGYNFLGIDGSAGNAITFSVKNDGTATFAGQVEASVFKGSGALLTDLPIDALRFRGNVDATTEAAPAAVAGDFYLNTENGTALASYTGIGGTQVFQNQFLLFAIDNEWHPGEILDGSTFVTQSTEQTISGTKTFTANQIFQSGVTANAVSTSGATSTGSLTCSGAATVATTLGVTGATTVGSLTCGDQGTFASTITAGDTSTGCQWFGNGSGIGRLSGTRAWYLNNTGDATFAGTVTAGDEVTTGTNIFASGSAQGIVSGSQKWYLGTDGSATFADSVNVQAAGNPATRVNLTASTGEIFCSTDKTDSTTMIRVQGGRGSANANDVVKINADGSITAAGKFTNGGGVDTSSDTNGGNVLFAEGGIYTQVPISGGDDVGVFQHRKGQVTTIKLMNGGSANFAGNVTAANFVKSDGTPVGGNITTISTSAPAGASPGDLWWDNVNGILYIYYTDVDSSQWVDARPAAGDLVTSFSNVFVGGTLDDPAIELNSEGSADFSGEIRSKNITDFKIKLTQGLSSATTIAQLKTAIHNALALL